MPIFSVIVPVYKAANTVERCVDSLEASGGEALEIILVEDCSPDDSWQICQRLAQKYPNVVCHRNERNRGVSYTRNQGLDLARGQYLLFTDSDDWVDADYVPSFRTVIEQGFSLGICGYVNHDEKHAGRTDIYRWNEAETFTDVSLCSRLQSIYDSCLLQQLWNKVFKTELVRQHGIRFDESISIGEDLRFILDYIQRTGVERVCLIDRPLYHYMRDQDGALMFRVGYESIDESLCNLRKLYEIIGVSDVERRLAEDRQKKVQSYAYLIMHNVGMPKSEKKRLICALDGKTGKKLYRDHRILYMKERLNKLLRGG